MRTAERGDAETSLGTVRYLAVPIRGDRSDGVFVVVAALGPEREEIEDAVRLAAIVLLSVLLIASALAWLLAGRILSPLQELGDTARSITESDLTRRIPVSRNDELAELARTFNAMLDRLESAFASQCAFVSDASHELRTPITIVRGHLELLGEDPEERRATIALVTDELDRMSRFVNDLLLLAKAGRNDFLDVGELELGALTDELLDKAAALAPRAWQLEGRAEALVRGDRQRLPQAIIGLAQNAVQHTADGDPIWIGSAVTGREARLWGPRLRARRAGRRPGAHLRALRTHAGQSQAVGRRGARALDRAGDRGGARRARRPVEHARPGRDLRRRRARRRGPDRRRRLTPRARTGARGRADYAMPRSRPSQNGARRSRLRILPTAVRGSGSVRISTDFGTL